MTGSDAALDVALTVIGQAVERAPRAMMLLDDQWNVLLANRHARGLPVLPGVDGEILPLPRR